jgi:Asp-tRNA(Asn)/Glu-tRNA(Gln) amidotransferase A subunit family amidase
MPEIEWMSAMDLTRAYAKKELSPLEVVKFLMQRISEVNPKINAFVTLLPGMAEEAAKEAERAYREGRPRSLEGVPVALKDNIFTAGVRTTYGSKLFEDFVPDEDAVTWERLSGAGAIMLGKTNMPEFGLVGITENSLFGRTVNPWDTGKTCGGSSGGSAAAVAAGLCPLAMGNDAAGSIRIPASLCGTFGIKPHFGRIPWYPHLPGFETLHNEGPLTRSVEDAALVLDMVAGPDRRDYTSLPAYTGKFLEEMKGDLRGTRVAYSPDLGYAPAVDSEVLRITRQAAMAFEDLGCEVEEIEAELPATCETDFTITALTEMMTANEERLEEYRSVAYPLYLPFFDVADMFSYKDVVRIQLHRYQLWEAVRKIFEMYDLLLCPTTIVPAFECEEIGPLGPGAIGDVEIGPGGWMLTMPFNFTGQPAASVPCGFVSGGLPVGLQIAGDRFQEALVLRASAAFESAHPWRDKKPPVD